MANKLSEMNAWRRELSAAGVDYPRSASYDDLAELAEKHLGSRSSSRRSSSKSRRSSSSQGSSSQRSRTRRQIRHLFLNL